MFSPFKFTKALNEKKINQSTRSARGTASYPKL